MPTYQLIDEPRPGAIAHVTVDPVWPLLSYMLGSAFFAWIWFLVNSFAVGSPNKRKEVSLIAFGFIGFFVLAIGATFLRANGVVSEEHWPYLRLVFHIFTLTICYILWVLQDGPFEIYRHFNGKVRKGFPILFLAIFFGAKFQEFIIFTVLGSIT